MKREIEERKEANMVSYDFSLFNKSGLNAGSNIVKIAGGDEGEKNKKSDESKNKDKSKKRKNIDIGNGNSMKQRK